MTTKIVVPGVAGIPLSTVTTAGDLIAGSGAGAVTRLALGATDGMVLKRVAGALGWQLADWQQIAGSTLVGSAANFDFTSIPATFTSLICVARLSDDNASVGTTGHIRFNNDSGANYDYQIFRGSNTTTSASQGLGQTSMRITRETGSTATAGNFGLNITFIPNYADATANKSAVNIGFVAGTTGTAATYFMEVDMGLWHSTVAVNELQIVPGAGSNFVAGSAAYLYGLR